MEISDTARRLHADSLVIDAHVHPSLKTYLFKIKLWKAHRSGGAFNPITMRVDLPKSIAGGIDTVAFGSDFDGFTDPPDDIKDVSQMPRLTAALLDAGLGEPDVEKVLGRNMERVLRAGWR